LADFSATSLNLKAKLIHLIIDYAYSNTDNFKTLKYSPIRLQCAYMTNKYASKISRADKNHLRATSVCRTFFITKHLNVLCGMHIFVQLYCTERSLNAGVEALPKASLAMR